MKFFLSGLCLLFIGLKLTNHIAWSWWWVMSPLWLPLSILVAVISILAVFSKTFRTGFRKSFRDHQAERNWEQLKKNLKYKDFEA